MHTVASLLNENEKQRVQIASLSAQIAALSEQLTEVTAQLAAMTASYAKQNTQFAELLAIAKRKVRKALPVPLANETSPLRPALAEKLQTAFDKRPLPPPKPDEKKKEEVRKKPTGRKALPDHLEAEMHALAPSACKHCGSEALDVADTVREEKLHVVKEHQRRRVVTRTTCRCRACGKRTTPNSLPAPYDRSKVTSEWLAWFVHQKFSLLCPLDRIRRDLAERGVPLAMSTLVTFIERAADLLAPIDGLHWQDLLHSTWMATDGTGLKVIVPELEKAHNGYIELYRNNDLAVFQYEADKSSENLVAKLRNFHGKITSDAESRFEPLLASGKITLCGCNAHGRRKFEAAEATQPRLAVEGGRFLGAIYGEEEKAQKQGLTGAALRKHRRTYIKPLARQLMRWIDAVSPTLLPSEPLAVAVNYYRNHHDELFRFLDDPQVPIDNSKTERLFQNVAKLRLNMLFAGSAEGAHRACVLLGIIATCKNLNISPQAYLAWAFDRLGTHREVFGLELRQMTPEAFKNSQIRTP